MLGAQPAHYLLGRPSFQEIAHDPPAQFGIGVYMRSFGRVRDSRAASSAFHARYASLPPCRAISRETTDSSRPIEAAISLFSSHFSSPRGNILPVFQGVHSRGLRFASPQVSEV